MKCLKLLGLAAIAAAAVTALVGTGTASATVFCSVTATPCNQFQYEVGVGVDAKFTENATFEDGSGTIWIECSEGTIKGKIAHKGSKTETVLATIESLTWGKCTKKVATVFNGFYEVHSIAGSDDGTVTGGNTEITLELFGVTCTYGVGGEDLGTISGGNPAILQIAVKLTKTAGGFLCPATGIWQAGYKFSEPVPLYVEAE